ncbi:MAG: IS630 family transposase, partial [Acidobacteria bacterium]|nr:IS630 family transposase [Acidobacteriota bacterium]MBI4454933.1 IS630 family transposase [Acidobacteriota bacterium]MBI4456689.1 IS630 family transposase [Acidobacteriota bacterium]
HNAQPKSFQWTKSADQILANIARFACQTLDVQASQYMSRINGTGD